MQKERAASALAHGLPVPTPPAARARSTEYSSSRPPGAAVPLSRVSGVPPGRRMPLSVKLLAGGLGLLVVVYGLTLFRDHKEAEAARVPAAPEPAAVAPRSAPASTVNDAIASAPATSAPVIAVSGSHSASGRPLMPQLAQRMKSIVAAIQAPKGQSAPPTSAVQPNVSAGLVRTSAAPADPAVK